MAKVQNVTVEPGYLVITHDSGPPKQIALTSLLRAVDVPDLNIDSLTLLTNLAQVVSILLETLIEYGLVEEDFASGYDLGYMVETLEDLNAEFAESEEP